MPALLSGEQLAEMEREKGRRRANVSEQERKKERKRECARERDNYGKLAASRGASCGRTQRKE